MLIDLSGAQPQKEATREYSVTYEGQEAAGYPVADAPAFALQLKKDRGYLFTASGEGKATLEIPCGRCLRPVSTEVLFSLDRSFDLQTGLDPDGDAVDFLQEGVLDTDRLIHEEIVMNLPIRVLCREDCRGICERCGANLNDGSCGCEKQEAPTRMADAIFAAMKAADKKK